MSVRTAAGVGEASPAAGLTSLAPFPNELKTKAMEMMAMIQSYFARAGWAMALGG